MRFIFTIIAILICQYCLASEQESFFLEDSETKIVLDAIKEKDADPKKISNNDFKLSGVFFIDENNWTVWINDKAYSSIGQQKEFSIDEVSENGVYLSLQDGKTIFLSVEIE